MQLSHWRVNKRRQGLWEWAGKGDLASSVCTCVCVCIPSLSAAVGVASVCMSVWNISKVDQIENIATQAIDSVRRKETEGWGKKKTPVNLDIQLSSCPSFPPNSLSYLSPADSRMERGSGATTKSESDAAWIMYARRALKVESLSSRVSWVEHVRGWKWWTVINADTVRYKSLQVCQWGNDIERQS